MGLLDLMIAAPMAAPLDASGRAVLTTATLPAGTRCITAAYKGDDSFPAAASAPLAQMVGKAPTATCSSRC
jgi:hypothetical protein